MDYSVKTIAELKQLMVERSIPGRSSITKKMYIINILEEYDDNPQLIESLNPTGYNSMPLSDLKKELASRNIPGGSIFSI